MIHRMWRGRSADPQWRMLGAVCAALIAFSPLGCARHAQTPQPGRITVYFCKAGDERLVPTSYSVDSALRGDALATYAVDQLLAGPSAGGSAIVPFPPGTSFTVSEAGDTATVDLRGPLATGMNAGTSDEVALFKSLTYTLTGLPGISRVQVLVAGRRVAALPGGHLDLSDPLTRSSFE